MDCFDTNIHRKRLALFFCEESGQFNVRQGIRFLRRLHWLFLGCLPLPIAESASFLSPHLPSYRQSRASRKNETRSTHTFFLFIWLKSREPSECLKLIGMNLSTKLTLYDFLSIFLSGSIWLLLILCIPCHFFCYVYRCCCHQPIFSFFSPLILSLTAYLLGLTWHKTIEWLCCTTRIKRFLNTFKNILEALKRNSPKLIEEAESRIMEQSDKKNVLEYSDNCLMRRYYFAYYYIQEKGALGSIPVLEAQEAFLRDIAFPLPLLLYFRSNWILEKLIECSPLGFFILRLSISIFVLIVLLIIHSSIQKKIHESVWDTAYYLHRLDQIHATDPNIIHPCSCDKDPKSDHCNNRSDIDKSI